MCTRSAWARVGYSAPRARRDLCADARCGIMTSAQACAARTDLHGSPMAATRLAQAAGRSKATVSTESARGCSSPKCAVGHGVNRGARALGDRAPSGWHRRDHILAWSRDQRAARRVCGSMTLRALPRRLRLRRRRATRGGSARGCVPWERAQPSGLSPGRPRGPCASFFFFFLLLTPLTSTAGLAHVRNPARLRSRTQSQTHGHARAHRPTRAHSWPWTPQCRPTQSSPQMRAPPHCTVTAPERAHSRTRTPSPRLSTARRTSHRPQ